jgi:CBS domain-containing protein
MTERLVRDVMRRVKITCLPNLPLKEVARMIAPDGAPEVVVMDLRSGIRGVIDRALIDANRTNLYESVAGDVLRRHTATISPEATLTQAVELMQEHKTRSLVVLDGDESTLRRFPEGIVSFTDIVMAVVGPENASGAGGP